MRAITTSSESRVGRRRIPGYASRMHFYFRTMFPLPSRMAQACLFSLSYLALLSMQPGANQVIFGLPAMIAVIDMFLLTLILRLMDELKDKDIDRRLFPHRPVPSGQVRTSDIALTLMISAGIYLVLNLMVTALILPALLALTYAAFMFVHFLAPLRHRKSLLLSLTTHNPITALMLVLLTSGFAATNDADIATLPLSSVAACLVMYWSLIASWELSRKIRAPEHETKYVTYSQVFGCRQSVLLLLLVQAVPVFIGSWLAWQADLSLVYVALLGKGYLTKVAVDSRFLRAPTARANRLQQSTELYVLLVCFSGLVELAIQRLWVTT